jgi:hypothetical protein
LSTTTAAATLSTERGAVCPGAAIGNHLNWERSVRWLSKFRRENQEAPGEKRVPPEECLIGGGWIPERSCDLAEVERALTGKGFMLHPVARQFLGEYYGLAVDVPISGGEGITGFVHFSPEMVLRFLGPNDGPRLAGLMPASACPVGTTGGHTMFIFLDDNGKSYLLDMEWLLFAELASSPAEMIEILCDGTNGRVDSAILDERGGLTREILRANDKRRHWQIEAFPVVSRFLPAVSLSPARRPPTWRAMVRSVEAVLASSMPAPDGKYPGVLVTCAGFFTTASKEVFLVAHCENSLYVRQRGGFQVAAPPPGAPQSFRTGECVPFTPPADWVRR